MRRIHKILILVFLPIVLAVPQKSNQRYHNFSGTVPVSLAGTFTLGQTDYKDIKIGFGASGMAEYFFATNSPTIYGFRLFLEGESLRGQDNSKTPTEFKSDLLIVGGGLTAGYSFNDRFFPYVFAGVSNIWFSPKDKDGKRLDNNRLGLYERSSISYDAEIGSRFVLNGVLSAFVGFGFHFPQTDYLDDVSKGSFDDFYYSGRIGISLSLFGKKDFDGDGILDEDDTCPSNPEDYDGFQDDDGCPDFDNDKDGIVDERDKCPNDPEDKDGFQDTDGCPDLDNDNDGIPDREDKCPNEPENINGFEDKDGCPDILDSSQRLLDNDKDGIVNNLDKCPDQAETINGFEDEDGCPDSIVVSDTISVKEMILEGSLLFDWRGTNIKPTAYEELDKTAAILVNDPFIKWAVNSYTDNNGNSDSLKSLSLERAKSVVRYLINTGLPSFMFRVYGKGGESPIGDNNTLEGRMKNNRIVIKRLD